MANHPIVHLDIPANDSAAAAQFYADVFGWQLHHAADVNYWMFSSEGGPGGGWVQPGPGGGGETHKVGEVLIYIQTDDIEASLAEVEAHGGQRVGQKVDMGPNG